MIAILIGLVFCIYGLYGILKKEVYGFGIGITKFSGRYAILLSTGYIIIGLLFITVELGKIDPFVLPVIDKAIYFFIGISLVIAGIIGLWRKKIDDYKSPRKALIDIQAKRKKIIYKGKKAIALSSLIILAGICFLFLSFYFSQW